MASKKDKLLESAQRFLLKGQLDKAIKDYQQVVALEPKEIRYRQKLAELLVRDNRKLEAITQYEDIGKHYADNSYFLKAIAVYKQIQRLSPSDTAISLTVASLNHKQGLTGNAMAEYSQIVAQMEKEGALKEAVQVLEQMMLVDPAHLATRLKHAELLLSSGAADASYQAFSDLLSSLRSGGKTAAVEDISLRMHQLFPERQENDLHPIAARISAGDLDGAIASLQEILSRDSDNLQGWQMLCDCRQRKGDRAGLRLAYQKMMTLFLDEPEVFKSGIRGEIEAGDFSSAVNLLDQHLSCFLQKGAALSAEELFLMLPGDVAQDPRVTDGLRRVYEASGEWDKLNALIPLEPSVSLDTDEVEPSADLETNGAPDVASAMPGAPAALEVAGRSTTYAAPIQSAPVPMPEWEEEIDLDLDDDLHLDATPAVAQAPAAPDVDLSLDFSLSLDFDDAEHQAHLPSDQENDSEGYGSSDASPFGELPESPEAELPASSEASPFGELPASSETSPFGELPASLEPSATATASFVEPSLDTDLSCFSDPFAPDAKVSQTELLPDLDKESSLDLTLPEGDDEFPPFEWAPESEDAEDVEEVETECVEESKDVEDVEEVAEPEDVASEDVAESEELQQIEEPDDFVPAPAARQLRGWEEIYPEAENCADGTMDLEELESHYDLGIGYKEMGMYNGAIKEFAVAAGNPQRRLDCLTLQAICHREKGEPEKAQDLLQRGLELEVLSVEERMSLSYELAFLFEATGAVDEAIRLYREVYKVNPAFHDVEHRLSALAGDEPLDFIELELEEAEC